MAIQLNIVDGPSKWDIMLAVFDASFQHPRRVRFKIELPEQSVGLVIAEINTISREDGSMGDGESWLFEGTEFKENRAPHPVRGWFRTDSRTGWLKFE